VLQASPGLTLGGEALKRHKRRRGNSHKRFSRFLRPTLPRAQRTEQRSPTAATETQVHSSSAVLTCSQAATMRPTNRRMRRKKDPSLRPGCTSSVPAPASAAAAATARRQDEAAAPQPASKFEQQSMAEGSRLSRLPTHRWHAPRFVMAHVSGFLLPEHASGKGHKHRSLTIGYTNRALLYDRSYFVELRVRGNSVEALAAALAAVLRHDTPGGSSVPPEAISVLLKSSGMLQLACALHGDCELGPCEVWPAVQAEEKDAVQAVVLVHPLMASDAEHTLQALCASQHGLFLDLMQ
jgi:hypothetical protein